MAAKARLEACIMIVEVCDLLPLKATMAMQRWKLFQVLPVICGFPSERGNTQQHSKTCFSPNYLEPQYPRIHRASYLP